MGRIPEHIVEEVRQRADAVDVIGRYLTLKKSGSRHWGLCPFHSEKTPSFQVHADKQMYHCFGCGESGDVFGFRMRLDNLDFPEAVRSLAREVGVEIPVTDDHTGKLAPLFKANEQALEFFCKTLRSPEGKPAREYLQRRGLPADLIERFQIGFAPPRWDGLLEHLSRQQVAIRHAVDAGLVAERQGGDGHYDRFRGRIVFPILEPNGRVIGFGGRSLGDDTPKYLNSPETPIYRKGRVLFGLPLAIDAIRSKRRAVVVEGYFDLIALHRADIREGVAPCGTAITQEHARALHKYSREVVLLFDGDAAGQQAAERALPVLCAEGLRVRAAFLPAGEDPDSLIESQGEAALRACVDSAVPLLDHLIEQRLMTSSEHAWEAVDRAQDLAPLLASLSNVIERESYIRKVASLLDLSPRAVEAELASTRRAPVPRAQPPADGAAAAFVPTSIDPISRTLISALCSFPSLVDRIDDLEPSALPGGPGCELLLALCRAVREHGESAVAHLLSPVAEELQPGFRSLLAEIAAQSEASSREQADRATTDCLARLQIEDRDRRSAEINQRLASCTNPDLQGELLEQKQENSRERARLWSQVHQ